MRTFIPIFIFCILIGFCQNGLSFGNEHLDSLISIDTYHFIDGSGKAIPLSDVFRKDRPVILAVLDDDAQLKLVSGLQETLMELHFQLGQDFDVVAIKPMQMPAGNLHLDARWNLLSGADPTMLQLKEELGLAPGHPPGIVILTSDGKVSRYLDGIALHAKDIKFALIEASRRQIGNFFDQILFSIFHFDEVRDSYTIDLWKIVTIVLILQALIFGVFLSFFGEKREALKKVT